jgi:regulator of protease activity HflC (stomatin/prohibitin superfamily)
MMSFLGKQAASAPHIHNKRAPGRRTDFVLGSVGLAVLAILVALILAGRAAAGGPSAPGAWILLLGAPLAAVAAMTLFPRWSAAIKLLALALVAALAWGASGAASAEAGLALAFMAIGVLAAPAVQKADEWERSIVLRLGKFHRVRGPGIFLLFPLVDRVARSVDLRIRVTDFTAETTLTRDSVTITVDALCFWLVWDAEKAVCEVEDYEEAVALSAKTALRSAVSSNDLTTFLERGDEIEDRIRKEVDEKTTEWGVTVQHIEITDVQIPELLQDSLSRLAQAEREKKGRILLAEAEIEIAHRLEEAARVYGSNEAAMRLKSLSVLNEGLKAGNSMMLLPDSIAEDLKSRDLFGLQALGEARRAEAKEKGEEGGDGRR